MLAGGPVPSPPTVAHDPTGWKVGAFVPLPPPQCALIILRSTRRSLMPTAEDFFVQPLLVLGNVTAHFCIASCSLSGSEHWATAAKDNTDNISLPLERNKGSLTGEDTGSEVVEGEVSYMMSPWHALLMLYLLQFALLLKWLRRVKVSVIRKRS